MGPLAVLIRRIIFHFLVALYSDKVKTTWFLQAERALTSRCGIYRCVASYFPINCCRRSWSITNPSKRHSSTTSSSALSPCRRNCCTTNPSKRNSSATSHFALSRFERACCTTNPSKRNSSATSHIAINRWLICSTTTPVE